MTNRSGTDHFGKVAVLMGGSSAEREISLKTGHAVWQSLIRQGVNATQFDPVSQPLAQVSTFDRAFIALHGKQGEDGSMQGALELLGVPYTGSGILASALAMDKWRCKLLWQKLDVPTPAFCRVQPGDDLEAVAERLGLPLFVKPAREGSSIGVSKVYTQDQFASAVKQAARCDDLVLAEQFVAGGEYTTSILGSRSLPVVRIVPATDFYDYEAKYVRDDTQYHCPSGLDSASEAKINAQALRAFQVLGCQGWGRVDFMMDQAGRYYFLEANTVPGMTDHSLFPIAARAAGISFDTLVLHILEQTL